VRCQVVIDGSDRGDLLPLAEAPFRLGWEPQEQWGEPSAPSQERLNTEIFFREQPVQSPTWVVMGQLHGDALAPGLPEKPRLPAPFEQACEAFGLERTITYGRLPGGLVMLNWPLHGNDWHWGLERAFSGNASEETELYREMQEHSLRFAQALEEATGGWLHLGDAFPADSGSPAPWLAAMPYWREGRRMVGRTTLTEQNLLPMAAGASMAPIPVDERGRSQSVAVGNYVNDHHYPGDDWPLAPKACRWGGRWTGTPFCIPYGCVQSEAIDNLLAADKAISTSHMANGATRLQPLVLNVGQAAGAAAALAVQSGLTPPEVAVWDVQRSLLLDARAPAAVTPEWNTAWHHPGWLERQLGLLNRDSNHDLNFSLADGELRQSDPYEHRNCNAEGMLERLPDRSYQIIKSNGITIPLITLEPEVNSFLHHLRSPMRVSVRGRWNPCGPWMIATTIQAV
jgi:hypothetical protein